MLLTVFTQLKSYFLQANQWLYGTPERSLDQAYQAALKIKAIEDEHFGGKKISLNSNEYGKSVTSYFVADLKKYLNIVNLRLTEFKASRSVVNLSEQNPARRNFNSLGDQTQRYSMSGREESSIIIEKLNFIDEVLARYTSKKGKKDSYSLVTIPKSNVVKVEEENIEKKRVIYQPISSTQETVADVETATDKTGILPRSLLRTFTRIKRELDPQAEDEVIKNFRTSKIKTVISIKFILLLILVPLLTQQVTKNFLVGPIVDRLSIGKDAEIFLNVDLEEEAFMDLERFEKELKFKNLIGLGPKISEEEIEEQVKNKAIKMKEEYADKSINAIKNVLADTLSVVAFAGVIFTSKEDIRVLKSFIDEVVYGLSDSAKAFIIILFTDIFVGYHSPHGWEVILKGLSRHLGLPENEEFNFLFIATFPVILDTIFKYWIFRYLNRISPSAVATYRNMNE
ncbi:MAG: proton extrusion protein PcxA [Aphanothece sp. CMT-3BRIN-NPC111]|jgi:hypothetical protein|nr:proton extrusion protein PcxA [Aphanothece sp. CMT-3BRIN-NPC111]